MCYSFTFGGVVNTEYPDSHYVEEMAPEAYKNISYGAFEWLKESLPTINAAFESLMTEHGRKIIPVSEVIDEIDNLTFEAPDTCDQATHDARVNFFKWWAVEAIRDFGDDAKLYVS